MDSLGPNKHICTTEQAIIWNQINDESTYCNQVVSCDQATIVPLVTRDVTRSPILLK